MSPAQSRRARAQCAAWLEAHGFTPLRLDHSELIPWSWGSAAELAAIIGNDVVGYSIQTIPNASPYPKGMRRLQPMPAPCAPA
jgi:hypothetical protein